MLSQHIMTSVVLSVYRVKLLPGELKLKMLDRVTVAPNIGVQYICLMVQNKQFTCGTFNFTLTLFSHLTSDLDLYEWYVQGFVHNI